MELPPSPTSRKSAEIVDLAAHRAPSRKQRDRAAWEARTDAACDLMTETIFELRRVGLARDEIARLLETYVRIVRNRAVGLGLEDDVS